MAAATAANAGGEDWKVFGLLRLILIIVPKMAGFDHADGGC